MEQLKGREPRYFQFRLAQAQEEGQDTVCQAATGQGKTGAAAAPYALEKNADKVTLMVSPLIVLQNEMVKTFRDEFGLPAVAISSAVEMTDALFRDIVTGKYRIVLLSPEMLLSTRFIERVIRKPAFRSRVYSIFVDEAHCISHWGADFRKQYGRIGTVRALLPPDVPVIAVSATLTRRVTRNVVDTLQLNRSKERRYLHLNMGNDRANVSLIVRPILNAMNTYTDLDFVIPSQLSQAPDIPKTWIYVDNIKTGDEIVNHLRSLVPEHLHGVIRPFNAVLSQEYREEAMRLFKSGVVRVLVCTDAAGMGCNVPDIEYVIQWRKTDKLSSFMQRAGRAARALGAGFAIMLVEPAAYTVYIATVVGRDKASGDTSSGTRPSATTQASKKEKKMYGRAHGRYRGARNGRADVFPPSPEWVQLPIEEDDDTEGMYHFVQSRTCRREILCQVFHDSKAKEYPVPCCDVCCPSLLDLVRPGKNKKETSGPRLAFEKEKSRSLWNILDDWREEYTRTHAAWQAMGPECVLSNEIMDRVARLKLDKFNQHLNKLLQSEWILWDEQGKNLVDHILASYPHHGETGTSERPSPSMGSVTLVSQVEDVTSSLSEPERSAKRRRTDDGEGRGGEAISIAQGSPDLQTPRSPPLSLQESAQHEEQRINPHPIAPAAAPSPLTRPLRPLPRPRAKPQAPSSASIHPIGSDGARTTGQSPYNLSYATPDTRPSSQASRAAAIHQTPSTRPYVHTHTNDESVPFATPCPPPRVDTRWARTGVTAVSAPSNGGGQGLAYRDGVPPSRQPRPSLASIPTPPSTSRRPLAPLQARAPPSSLSLATPNLRPMYTQEYLRPPVADHNGYASAARDAVHSQSNTHHATPPHPSNTPRPSSHSYATPVGTPLPAYVVGQQEFAPNVSAALRADTMRLGAPCLRGGSCRVGRTLTAGIVHVARSPVDGAMRPLSISQKATVLCECVFHPDYRRISGQYT